VPLVVIAFDGVPANVTEERPAKLLPEIATTPPPAVPPVAGRTWVTVGSPGNARADANRTAAIIVLS
jgi:hypothetical protein